MQISPSPTNHPDMSRKHLAARLCEIAEIPIILQLESGGQLTIVLSKPNKLQIAYSQASTPKTFHSILHSMQGCYMCNVNLAQGKEPMRVKNTLGRAVKEFVFVSHWTPNDKTFCSVHEIRLRGEGEVFRLQY